MHALPTEAERWTDTWAAAVAAPAKAQAYGLRRTERMQVLQHSDLMSPSANAFQIIDVYIYGDYEILDEAGQAVPYKRAGSRIAEVQGKPDVRQITSDVLETGVGRIAICGKLCHFLLLQ